MKTARERLRQMADMSVFKPEFQSWNGRRSESREIRAKGLAQSVFSAISLRASAALRCVPATSESGLDGNLHGLEFMTT